MATLNPTPVPPVAEKKTIKLTQVPLSALETLTVSCCAGMLAWTFTHPFEMWKNAILTSPEGMTQLQGFRQTAQRGFYRGIVTGWAKQTLYATGRLGFYPPMRDAMLRAEVSLGIRDSPDAAHATIAERAVAASAAGIVASFIASPVDVCLVLQSTSPTKTTFMSTFKGILERSGPKGLWRGVDGLCVRTTVTAVTSVAMQDHVVTWLRQKNKEYNNMFSDNTVIHTTSVLIAIFGSIIGMPIETARLRLSNENKLPPGATRRYFNMFQTMALVCREEGFLRFYSAWLPYLGRSITYSVVSFFCLEYGYREMRRHKAAKQGLTLEMA